MTGITGRLLGIDYSGAETPNFSLKGLRVYSSDQASSSDEVPSPRSLRRYWTRREIAESEKECIMAMRTAGMRVKRAGPFRW